MVHARWWAGLLATSGVFTAGSAVWHLLRLEASVVWLHWLIDLVLLGGASVGLLYGSYWHSSNGFDAQEYPRILVWMLATSALFVSLAIISLYLGSRQVIIRELVEVIHLNGVVGVVAGLLIGTIHTQAVTNAEAAARAETEAEALAAEQERREKLTDLLRHYILNAVTVISGYASLLQNEVATEHREKLAMIENNAETMATLVTHIRSLQRAESTLRSSKPLPAIIETVSQDVEADTDVEVQIPDSSPSAPINKDVEDALQLLCEALVTVITDTTTSGSLHLACERTDTGVTIVVTATPATLPETVKQSLFEPVGTGIELQLYLAHELVTDSGSLELVDTAAESLCFRLVVEPAASTPV